MDRHQRKKRKLKSGDRSGTSCANGYGDTSEPSRQAEIHRISDTRNDQNATVQAERHSLPLQSPNDLPRYDKNTVENGGFGHLGDVYGMVNHYHNAPQNPRNSELGSDRVDILLESLVVGFEIHKRRNNVKEALPKTCGWLYDHKKFQAWTEEPKPGEYNGFLWIEGKPGCGKSTIMKSALAWVEKEWRTSWTAIFYFFNARAVRTLENSVLENSSLGLYRSLVYQAVVAQPELKIRLFRRFSSKLQSGSAISWTETELQNFLIEIVKDTNPPKLCIFIDALDEGDEDDVRSLVAFLEQLVMHASSPSETLRICLSSRHYPFINTDKKLSLIVEKEVEHDQDMEVYIRETLATGNTSSGMEKFREDVRHKSQQIFLWVVLVVPMLNKIHARGGGLSAMRKRLSEIPRTLNELFVEILDKSSDDTQECAILLQWVLFSMRPLKPVELYIAVNCSRSSDVFVADEEAVAAPDEDSLDKYLLDRSRGLIELTKSDPPTIQFIHETVREFLTSPNGLCRIEPGLTTNAEGRSHDMLKSGCLRYISCCRVPADLRPYAHKAYSTSDGHMFVPSTPAKQYPFIDYSVRHVIRHADQAQACDISQTALLDNMRDSKDRWGGSEPEWFRWWWWHNILERYPPRKYGSDNTLLYVLAEQNAPHLVQILLDGRPNIDAMGGRHGTALQSACFAGHAQVVQCLIEHKADVNTRRAGSYHALTTAVLEQHFTVAHLLSKAGVLVPQEQLKNALASTIEQRSVQGVQILLNVGADPNAMYGSDKTILYVALRRGTPEIVKLLLQRGAEANARHHTSRFAYPLQVACFYGEREHVRLLLDHRADVNARGGEYETALQAACYNGSLESVQLLLDNGADVNARGGAYETALQAACVSRRLENAKLLVKLLLDNGADINAKSADSECALIVASRDASAPVVQSLVEAGAGYHLQRGVDHGVWEEAIEGSRENRDECAREPILKALQSGL